MVEVDIPDISDTQVLVRVQAASVNSVDCRLMRGEPILVRAFSGLRRPKDPRTGIDVAGRVTAVGKNVTQFKVGDEVFGTCGGAFAEFAVGSSRSLALKPASLSFEQAAALPVAGVTALQSVKVKGQLLAGQNVLINGAGGGVGTFSVQIAKAIGGVVTAISSSRNAALVRSLGADFVIEYDRQRFPAGERRYDLLIDNVGNLKIATCRKLLSPHGRYVLVGAPKSGWIAPLLPMLKVFVHSKLSARKMITLLAKVDTASLTTIKELVEAEKISAVIDRVYSLSEVPAAFRHLEEGHTGGKVIIRL